MGQIYVIHIDTLPLHGNLWEKKITSTVVLLNKPNQLSDQLISPCMPDFSNENMSNISYPSKGLKFPGFFPRKLRSGTWNHLEMKRKIIWTKPPWMWVPAVIVFRGVKLRSVLRIFGRILIRLICFKPRHGKKGQCNLPFSTLITCTQNLKMTNHASCNRRIIMDHIPVCVSVSQPKFGGYDMVFQPTTLILSGG